MQKFVKLLARDLRHHEFQYKEGLNVDSIPFDANGSCRPGGLYFTNQFYIGRWISDEWPLAADVTLPPDALVYQEPCHTKWKADRLILSNIRPLYLYIEEHAIQCSSGSLEVNRGLSLAVSLRYRIVLNQGDVGQCLEAIKHNPLNLAFIERQTPQMCELAVSIAGCALRHVKQQTEALCLAAIENNPKALQYVREQTEEMCVLAIRLDKSCVTWVKRPSERMWALFDHS